MWIGLYDRIWTFRYNQKWGVIDRKAGGDGYSKKLVLAGLPKSEVPNGIKLFSGSAYIVATREFMNWTMTNETPQNVINWSKDTFSPDEMIWATLSRVEQAPGTVLLEFLISAVLSENTRYLENWIEGYRPTHGRWDMNEMESVARAVKWIGLFSSEL